jgi:hypothetical protein
MLHGTSPDGTSLADAAVILSVMPGLIAKGVIDHMMHACGWRTQSRIQEDKNTSRKKAEAIAAIRNEFVPLIG